MKNYQLCADTQTDTSGGRIRYSIEYIDIMEVIPKLRGMDTFFLSVVKMTLSAMTLLTVKVK